MANLFFIAALALFASLPHSQSQQRGTVRLWRNGRTSPSYSSGRVQIYISRWGNICADFSFFSNEAHVVCHQLGYSSAFSFSKASRDTYGTDSLPILVVDVSCSSSNYLVILECSHTLSVSNFFCENGRDDLSITCFTLRIWDNPYDGQIRLQRGLYTSQGLVEVYCNEQWGTVCDDTFGSAEADTVCRQLGYTSAARYDHLSVRGTSSQPIWLDMMTCSSATSCLRTCQRCPSSANQHNCDHSEDVTIECQHSGVSSFGNTRSTCDFGHSTRPTSHTSSSVGAYIGGVLGTIVFITCIVILGICVVLNINSSSRNQHRRRRTRARVRTSVPSPHPPTTTVVTDTTNTVAKNAPPAYPATAYPTFSAAYPPTEVGDYPPPQPAGHQLPPQEHPCDPPPYTGGCSPSSSTGNCSCASGPS